MSEESKIHVISVWGTRKSNHCSVTRIQEDGTPAIGRQYTPSDKRVKSLLEVLVNSEVGSFRPFWGPPGWVWMHTKDS